jgi:O-antigen/teichoic acid export membrane protein
MAITLLTPGIRSILTNTAYLSFARSLTGIARIVYAVLLARLLGAESYGFFNYGLSWYLIFIPLAALGLDSILIREIGRDRGMAPTLLSETLALRALATILVAVGCFTVGYYIDSDASGRNLLAIFSFALLGRSLAVWCQVVFIAYESSRLVLQQELVFRLLEVVLGIGAVLSGYGIIVVAAIHAGSWLLQGIIGQFLILKYLEKFEFRPNWSKLWGLVLLGLPFLMASFLFGWILQGALVLYRHIHGIDGNMGQLAMALQAMFILGSIAVTVTGPALPVLSRSVDRGDNNSDRFLSVALRGGILMGGLLAISGFSLGDWVVHLVLGNSYEETTNLLPWALLLITPLFLSGALGNVIVARGQYWLALIPYACGAFIFSSAAPLLIFYYKSYGALVALALGLLSAVIVNLLILRRSYTLALLASVFYPLICITLGIITSAALADFNAWLSLLAGTSVSLVLIFLTGVFSKSEFRAVIDALAQMVAKARS